MDTSKQPGLQIAQVLLLSAQFSHREDALAIVANTVIENLTVPDRSQGCRKTRRPNCRVALRASTEKDQDQLYKFDIEIAAVVTRVPGEENLDPFEYAAGMGPAAFFPFLREAVANITMKGRFGAVWLKPMNFTAVLQQPSPDSAAVVEG